MVVSIQWVSLLFATIASAISLNLFSPERVFSKFVTRMMHSSASEVRMDVVFSIE